MLRIYERNRASLRSVFMGKESAKCLLANVVELMSNVPLGNYARTFKDGDKVFILQLGSNAYGNYLFIYLFFYDLRTCSWLLERLHPCARRKTG